MVDRLPRVKLLLLDGHSLAYRAFFALPAENFSTSTGQNTNAVYGFTAMLINVLRDEAPTHVGVAFDVSRQTFRAAEYAEYKAGRSATPTEFSGQLPLLREVLDALRIRHLGVEGFEADDVIATLTRRAVEQGHEVVICTGDRDAFQLVSDKVTLLYPVRGVSEVWRMDPAAVTEKYLVAPERYSDLAALVGESSDNLPGVPGVGPKTAAKWLSQYGDLAGVVAHVDEIRGKAGENLRAHLDGVLRNRRLNRLVDDLDLPLSRRRPRAPLLGPRGGAPRLRRPRVPRAARAAVRRPSRWRRTRSRVASTSATRCFTADDALGPLRRRAPTARTHPRARRRRVGYRGGQGDADAVALAEEAGGARRSSTSPALTREQEDVLAGLARRPRGAQGAPRRQGAAAGPVDPWADRWPASSPTPRSAAYLVRPDQRSFDLEDLVVRHLGRELKAEAAGR